MDIIMALHAAGAIRPDLDPAVTSPIVEILGDEQLTNGYI
jgi:hypothetical protein